MSISNTCMELINNNKNMRSETTIHCDVVWRLCRAGYQGIVILGTKTENDYLIDYTHEGLKNVLSTSLGKSVPGAVIDIVVDQGKKQIKSDLKKKQEATNTAIQQVSSQ